VAWNLIARALMRHKVVVGLLLLQCLLAVPLFVVGTSIFLERLQAVTFSSGIDENHLVYLHPRIGGVQREGMTQDDFAALYSKIRIIEGVQSVALSNALPFLGTKTWEPVVASTQEVPTGYRLKASVYSLDQHFLPTAGLHVIEGRNFTPDEFIRASPLRVERFGIGLITQSLAQTLFAQQGSVGKRLFMDGKAITIVGVVSDVARPQYLGPVESWNAVLVPTIPFRDDFGRVMSVRLSDQTSPTIFAARLLSNSGPPEIGRFSLTVSPFSEARKNYFSLDILVLWIVSASMLLLALVIGCGIGGLSSFWAGQRSAKVVTLRALGATRSQARSMLFKENLLICLVGAFFGCFLAYTTTTYLNSRFGISQGGPLSYALAVISVAVIGQFSIMRPALSMANADPALASRA